MVWVNHNCRLLIDFPTNIPYFLDTNSTTERARAIDSTGFKIDLLCSCFEKPLPEEAHRLRIDLRHRVWVREVVISLLSFPIMFARAVVPYAALEDSFRRIKHLENESLGRYLFRLPNIQRESFDIKKLQQGDCMYEKAMKYAGNKKDVLWARRSIFRLRSALLLTEVFLPEYSSVFKQNKEYE
jgi:chorismate-pyruvate lyase